MLTKRGAQIHTQKKAHHEQVKLLGTITREGKQRQRQEVTQRDTGGRTLQRNKAGNNHSTKKKQKQTMMF